MPPRASPQIRRRAPVKHRTAWHPMFVSVLRHILPPRRYRILSEHQLNFQPLRIDVVVVRRDRSGRPPRTPVLAALTHLLGPITLIELKGPTDHLRRTDFLVLLAYAALFCARHRIQRPAQVHLMVVASRLTPAFREQVQAYRGTFSEIAPGVHEVKGLDYALYCLETEIAGDHILHLFSPSFVQDPSRAFSLLTDDERAIFRQVYREVEQFTRDPRAPLEYADYEVFTMSVEEFAEEIIASMPPERLLRHVPVKERLKGLSPEERLKGLSPEERLKGLSPEERLKGLTPRERARLKRLLG
jgi:hypothetical protein